MKNIFVSSRLNRLTITAIYFIIGGIWALYSNKLFDIVLPQHGIARHSAGPCYWCFIVLSSGLLYLLLKYWGSAQAESQQSLHKMDRSLKSYSECTKAMIQAENEITLMQDICRICVDVGGHRMAWVAFAENDPEKSLRPVTHWGAEGCFFEGLQATWADTEQGQGPAGISIRTGKPVVFQDLMTTPRYELCRESAQKCNYASCISLPMRDDKQIFGALVIFDAKPNAFDKEKAFLLEELADDLSYGIKTLRLRAERKQDVEKRLMLAAVTEQTSDGVITFAANGTIEYLNPSFIKLCGVPADEGVGVSIHDFECSKRNPEFYQAVRGTLETDTASAGRFVNKDREGSEHDIDARISPVFDKAGRVVRYVVMVRDVSQELQLQRQLRQAQKMEALATLSRGIAHDFNNILAIILTNSEVGIIEDGADKSAQENLLRIHKAALRGKKAVKQFMTINRQSEQPKQPVKISDTVKTSLKTFQATLPSMIKLTTDVVPGLGLIAGEPTQIHQVIMNLCTNARDALQAKGGILEVSLTSMDIPIERMHQYPDLLSGKHVKLTITDTGHGMDREELEHIFDPFYTTKGQGHGRGLGLSITHGIIKNHGGIIYVNSIVEVGTTFVILLPLIDSLDPQQAKSVVEQKSSLQEQIVSVGA